MKYPGFRFTTIMTQGHGKTLVKIFAISCLHVLNTCYTILKLEIRVWEKNRVPIKATPEMNMPRCSEFGVGQLTKPEARVGTGGARNREALLFRCLRRSNRGSNRTLRKSWN
jgi:hypothetical protein